MSKIIAANLKMNLNYDDIINYKNVLVESKINVIVAPSNIYLREMISNSYSVCAQNAYYEDKGAYTGEISFNQLKSIGVNYSLIGHSERRHIFNEKDEDISLKIDSCINNDIVPILCIGETKEEKENNKCFDVVKNQIDIALKNKNIDKLIIAYEPVWSIGTGLIPSYDDIKRMHEFINSVASKYCSNIKILYGGSVKETNIVDICNIDFVDGVLIGGASLDPNNLVKMYNSVN